MKRSVAIHGSTPAFLRWAIWHECPLRDLGVGSQHRKTILPDSTFRQLRGLRELSLATIEDRIVDGVCLHPDWADQDAQTALGFSVEEIVESFGGAAAVNHCCRSCPANAGAINQSGLLVGCFGWLPTNLNFDFESAIRGQASDSSSGPTSDFASQPVNLIELFETVIKATGVGTSFSDLFLPTTPAWYGSFAHPILSNRQLELLSSLFERVLVELDSHSAPPVRLLDLQRFEAALRSCLEASLPLHVELIPAGFSDGRTWTIQRHCQICKSPRQQVETASSCPACGAFGHEQNEIKSKVLGVRPYVHLHAIYGTAKTNELLELQSKKSGK
jgi:hypothetical protein